MNFILIVIQLYSFVKRYFEIKSIVTNACYCSRKLIFIIYYIFDEVYELFIKYLCGTRMFYNPEKSKYFWLTVYLPYIRIERNNKTV